ncbi:hypothetical protein Tco_0455780 [Tanacetum coccineum]
MDITSRNKTIEAKVYRKWVSMSVSDPTRIGFSWILISRKGGAIQANMDFRDVSYFDVRLEQYEAYMITNFRYEPTKKFNQTLDNLTLLSFRRFTRFKNIPNHGFPNHYFIFEAYNELDARKTVQNAILAGFDVKHFKEMDKPIIIVVSSCGVSDYGGVQLTATPTTHYYLNPYILDLQQIIDAYKDASVLPMSQRSSGLLKQNLGSIPVAKYVIIMDDITSVNLTCVTPEAKSLPIPECEYLFQKVESKDPLEISEELKALEGTKHIFEIHFSPGCKKGRAEFCDNSYFSGHYTSINSKLFTLNIYVFTFTCNR